jgi:hypothetical protein
MLFCRRIRIRWIFCGGPNHERAILENFKHLLLYCDNECAVGISNSLVTQKMPKFLDMRLHCVRDRVRQGQFVVQHLPGLQNIVDFFTRALPVVRHNDLAPFLALDDDQTIDDIEPALLFAALYQHLHQARVLIHM